MSRQGIEASPPHASTEGATERPWRVVAQGGSSTILTAARPKRNDTRIPTYGHRPGGEHCIAYPFLNDDGSARWDFVCFSHDDAALIVKAVNCHDELVAALDDLQQAESEYRLMHDRHGDASRAAGRAWDLMRRAGDKARAAIARAS